MAAGGGPSGQTPRPGFPFHFGTYPNIPGMDASIWRHAEEAARSAFRLMTDPRSPLHQQMEQAANHAREHLEEMGPSQLHEMHEALLREHANFMSDPNHPIRRQLADMMRNFGANIPGAPGVAGVPNGPGHHTFHFHFTVPGRFQAPGPPPVVPPTRRLPEDAEGECVVCLEALQANQPLIRPACLHQFHEPCLKEWLKRSPTCPTCKLQLATPNRKLLYTLKDVEGLAASELKYLAAYLGLEVERGCERAALELAVLSSPHVKLSSSRQELTALPVKQLQSLLQCAGVKTAGLSEKKDLVDALLGSNRCSQLQCPEPLQPCETTGPRRTVGQSHRSAPY